MTVAVDAVNDAPQAVEDAAMTPENTAVDVDVLANDSDVDGDTLSVTSVTHGISGTVVISGANSVTYTPDTGFQGADSFTYTVSDGQGGADEGTVTILVGLDPDAIDEGDDIGTTSEGQPVIIDVLANDQPAVSAARMLAQANPLAVVGVTRGGHGLVTINPGHSLTYIPDPYFNGADNFSYTVTDWVRGADTAIVAVTVIAVNDAPDAVSDVAAVDEDMAVNIPVLANDDDVDGDAISVSYITPGGHGVTVVNVDDTVTYMPAPNFNGLDHFGYTASDGHGGSDAAVVQVTVEAVNDAPDAVDDAITTIEDTAAIVNALVNDTDVDGDALSVTEVTQGNLGSVAINGDGAVTYTPDPNANGSDTFTYTVSDGAGSPVSEAASAGDATATVMATILAVNDPPVFTKGPNQTVPDNAGPQVVAGWATDISAGPTDESGQSLAFYVTNDHSTLFTVQPTVNPATGDLSFTPAIGANGSAAVTVILKDNGGAANGGVGASAPQTFTISICTTANLGISFVTARPGASVILTAQVSNSGSAQVAAGLPVAFYLGDPANGGTLIDTAAISQALGAGDSEDVTVTWSNDTPGDHTIFIVANDGNPLNLCGAPPTAQQIVSILDVPLSEGWNLMSAYVNPFNTDTSVVQLPIAGQYVVIQGFDGEARSYYPPGPDWPPDLNTLKDMDAEHGYWIKVKGAGGQRSRGAGEQGNAATLRVVGEKLAEDQALELDVGWNLVSYLPRQPQAVPEALQSIDGQYTAVLGYDQDALSYYPDIDPDFNTLHKMKSLFGYWIKMSQASTLHYLAAGGGQMTTDIADQPLSMSPVEEADELHPTPWFIDFVGKESTLGGQPLPVGAVIRAYDPSGVLAGRAEVTLSGWYLMPVYGNDPQTDLDEGAESGDTITFTVDDRPAVPLGPVPPLWVGAGSRVYVELETCSLFGDLDCDCDVDVADVMAVASKWRCRRGDECYDARCDLDDDDDIDVVDIMLVSARWGDVCSP